MDWAFVLVIILSIVLALFLILGIILVILLIRVTLQIKSVTESAKRTATGIEELVGSASRFSSASSIAKLVFDQAKKIKKRKG